MTGADTHPDEQPRDPQALIDLMDESQALRFKQAIVRQAIAFAEEIVAHNPTVDDADTTSMAAARAWLADPTPEREEVPLQILIDAGHAVREDYMPGLQHMLRFPGFPDYGYRLNKGAGTTLNLAGVVASDMRNVRGGVHWTFGMRGIVEHYGRVRGGFWPDASEAIYDPKLFDAFELWMVEAARKVLQGQEPLPFSYPPE